MQSTVTCKAQIALPKELRRLLQLETGDKVAFVTQDDGQVVARKSSPPSVAALRGVLPKPPKPLCVEAMNEAIAQAAAELHRGRYPCLGASTDGRRRHPGPTRAKGVGPSHRRRLSPVAQRHRAV